MKPKRNDCKCREARHPGGDEKLEILAIDVKGRLLCIDYEGEVLWYVSLSYNPNSILTSEIMLGNLLKSRTVVVVTIQEVDHIRVFTIIYKIYNF